MLQFCVLGNKAGGVPLLTRHPSATALLVPFGGEVLLFDCAEGTQLQLMRAKISRGAIQKIFITHLHVDHLLGLAGLLPTYSTERRSKELKVYGPKGLAEWLHVSLDTMDVRLRYPLTIVELPPDFQGVVDETEHYQITALPLEHRVPCFGYRWEEKPRRNVDMRKVRALGITEGKIIGEIKRRGSIEYQGRQITLEDISHPPKPPRVFVYCGDTRPCDNAVQLAMNATVLLHEATFANEHQQKAAEYFHSTAAEAAGVAKAAGVNKLFLIHISARYKRLRTLLKEARVVFPRTFVAKELQRELILRPRRVADDSAASLRKDGQATG